MVERWSSKSYMWVRFLLPLYLKFKQKKNLKKFKKIRLFTKILYPRKKSFIRRNTAITNFIFFKKKNNYKSQTLHSFLNN